MTHPTRIALLDLDGTLTESHMGIQESAKIAYRHFNKRFPAQTEFDTFIGPPLYEIFTARHIRHRLLKIRTKEANCCPECS